MNDPAVEGRPLRLFIAAEAPGRFRDACDALRQELRSAIPGARWSRPEGIHLTLKFLGAAREERLAGISSALAEVAGAERPFDLVTGRAGTFGGASHPRTLWVAVEGESAAAARLAASLDAAMARLGFPREARAFSAHLTLARFERGRGARLTEEAMARVSESLAGIPFPVRELTLFESHMMAGGSRYIARARAPLGHAGRDEA